MKTIEAKIYIRTILANILVSCFIFLYSSYIVRLPHKNIILTAIVIIGFISLLQLILKPLFNLVFFKSIRVKMHNWQEYGLKENERTKLVKELMKLPIKQAKKTFLFFFVFSIWIFIFYRYQLYIDLNSSLICFFSCIILSLAACLFSLDITERIVSIPSQKLIQEGIDEKEIKKYEFFGNSMKTWYILYLAIPAVITNLLSFFILLNGFFGSYKFSMGNSKTEFLRMSIIIILNTLLSITLILILGRHLFRHTKNMEGALEQLASQSLMDTKLLSTDLSNELSHNMYLINKIIHYFMSIYMKSSKTGKTIEDATRSLALETATVSTTALQQASGIKEILAVMEDTNTSAYDIEEITAETANRARNASDIVEEGFKKLEKNLAKMEEITETNVTTISGIKALGEKIESIWEIVTMIEKIAERSKIIAFNAELEAAEAGEDGKNFHIVANEIHRLASNTTDSVSQIKKRITEIQHSSDNLIISSESGTEKIREGCELSESLSSKFSDIRSSSEITAESAEEITDIIHQQTFALEQILTTIRQLSIGVESFSESTATIETAAKELEKTARTLKTTTDKIQE